MRFTKKIQFDNCHFNYLSISLQLPHIFIGKSRDTIGNPGKRLVISFPTMVDIGGVDEISWHFNVQLLGFGINILRQWSY